MPSGSSKASLIEFLARQGFYVVFPRYRGSWESGGSFLKREPTKDISDVMQYVLKNKKLRDLWGRVDHVFPDKPKIYIFAGSFGGPAGILLSGDVRVEGFIAVSPVVDWTMESKAEPIDEMYDFAKLAYGEGYRMKKSAWNKLGTTSFYDPLKQLEKVDGTKIIIFHAKDDESVPFATVATFAEKVAAKFVSFSRGGHLRLNMVTKSSNWRRVEKFIDELGKT